MEKKESVPKIKGKREFSGRVVSDKMDKTIVIQIERRTMHRLYKKYVKRTRKIKVHDENNECNINDVVRVYESRPFSKEKRWNLLEIVERAK